MPYHVLPSDENVRRNYQSRLSQVSSLFVNSVLSLRKSCNIQKFHLTLTFDRYKSFDIKKFQAKCVETWILAAIGPHLQELILSISGYCIKLPPSFFISILVQD